MRNYDNFCLKEKVILRSNDDATDEAMLELLGKGIRYLLSRQDEYDLEENLEMWEEDFDDEEKPYEEISDFETQHACHSLTFTLLGSSSFKYEVLRISDQADEENVYTVIAVKGGNSTGVVYRNNDAEPCGGIEDGIYGTTSDFEVPTPALDILYRHGAEGQTISALLHSDSFQQHYAQHYQEWY